MEPLMLCLIFIVIPLTDSTVPGTFFWQPRLGINLRVPYPDDEGSSNEGHLPTDENKRKGLVVMLEGYSAGMSFFGLASDLAEAFPYPHRDPSRGYFYTNVYRWTLRYLKMLPSWATGELPHYGKTHDVWKLRFYRMEEMLPKWLKSALFYVNDDDWKRETRDLKRYKKFAEYAFTHHNRFPGKTFNNFDSFETQETLERQESSSSFQSTSS